MLVQVLNKNTHPYNEKFRERMISIPALSSIEMDEDEAQVFLQTFTNPRKDAQDRHDPAHFKMLKIVYPEGYTPGGADPLVCHANGQKAASVEDLAKLLANFSDRLADDKDAERSGKQQSDKAAKALKKENDDLKMQVKGIEDKMTKMLAFMEKLGGLDDTTS